MCSDLQNNTGKHFNTTAFVFGCQTLYISPASGKRRKVASVYTPRGASPNTDDMRDSSSVSSPPPALPLCQDQCLGCMKDSDLGLVAEYDVG